MEYAYDGLNRRIRKHVHNVPRPGCPVGREYKKETRFLWEGLRLLSEEKEGQTVVYVYEGPGSYVPLARVDRREEKTRISWYHCQVNGAPARLTNESGRRVWKRETACLGATVSESGEVEENLRFQGQYLDRETGLHYNLFRYYDPACGRFTQPDPIGLAGGLNQYQYAPNPLSYIDPLGLSTCGLRGSNGRFRSAKNIQEEISGLPNFTNRTPGQIRQTLRNRGYSSVQAHSGGEVWTKGLPDGNTVAVRIDPANPRSPSHYADAVPHVHIETVPTSSVSNGNYRPRDVTGRHTATGGISDRGTNPNHNADVHIPMSPGRFPYN